MYKIVFTKLAQKQYNKLSKAVQSKVARTTAVLSTDPFFGKKLGGEFEGLRTVRAWPYRVIYLIDKREVWVVSIKHRQGAYK